MKKEADTGKCNLGIERTAVWNMGRCQELPHRGLIVLYSYSKCSKSPSWSPLLSSTARTQL